MKKKHTQKKAAAQPEKDGRPTLLEYMAGFEIEAAKACGLTVTPAPDIRAHPVPEWGKKIFEQLQKTIMRPIIKLRPRRNCLLPAIWQDYWGSEPAN